MTPTVRDYLKRARHFLVRAREMLELTWADDASRAAYMAGFHAAHALVFEKTGRTPKTHSGLQGMFYQVAHDNPAFTVEHLRFLNVGYNLKSEADYDIGPEAIVSMDEAAEAVRMSESFCATIVSLIPDAGDSAGQEPPP